MSIINVGDRVADMDPGLAQIRAIMGIKGNDDSNSGTVESIKGDTAYINYDDGNWSPCPVRQLVRLEA